MYRDDFLQNKLIERLTAGTLRQLRLNDSGVDFCSNDYLGIVKNKLLRVSDTHGHTGSTGSRLLSGNYPAVEALENELAFFHQTDAALLFNSGYDANLGLLSSVPQKGDTVLYDQLCHASIRDGIRLSFAYSHSFLHNDLNDLRKKIEQATGNVFVVTESVFSMDGDFCPLKEMVELVQQKKIHLIVDEAHATGVIGKKGEGLVQDQQLQDFVFARTHTFGKACGCHGAVIVGSAQLKQYLLNFARSFVFTTALPEHSINIIKASYDTFPQMQEEREQLHQLISLFQQAQLKFKRLSSLSPIQIILIPGNAAAKDLALQLQKKGLDLRAILYPSVPKGLERLRIVLHAFNTREELALLIAALS